MALDYDCSMLYDSSESVAEEHVRSEEPYSVNASGFLLLSKVFKSACNTIRF